MQVLRLTGTQVVHVSNEFAIRHIRLKHTAAANAQVRDGATREVASLQIVTDPLYDDMAFTSPLLINGLDVVMSAGVLFIYLE